MQSVSPVIPLTSTHPIVNNVNINIGMHNIVTSVKELTYDVLNSFSYYPNPVKDKLNLVFNLEKQAMIDISIINVTGQVVNRYNYSLSEGSNTLSLDMSELSSGMYFVRINANSANAANFKIVK
ncbi:MAG: T9SS type A sorting domain-containing protein [Bacteroidales bacterium]